MASDDYYLEIEAHFAFRRATPFILSGKDWALMQRWRSEGIPLPIVVEAIDSVFEKNETSGRRKVIRVRKRGSPSSRIDSRSRSRRACAIWPASAASRESKSG